MARRLFCEISPLCYKLSLCKEYALRDIKDIIFILRGGRFAKEHSSRELPVTAKGHSSVIRRRLNGVDAALQDNKAENLRIAGEKLNGIVIYPGETFSFWRIIGKTTEHDGYRDGLVISGTALKSGIGGGLCQLANLIHWLVLNSPLEVTELHHHTDALFPDSARRVPFGTGTSVFYKNVDYRFKNTTDRPVQLLIWQDDDELHGELRCEKAFANKYRIVEEGSGYVCENGVYYRVSRIFKETCTSDGKVVSRELILNNHSRVMYDYSLIPKTEIITTS